MDRSVKRAAGQMTLGDVPGDFISEKSYYDTFLEPVFFLVSPKS